MKSRLNEKCVFSLNLVTLVGAFLPRHKVIFGNSKTFGSHDISDIMYLSTRVCQHDIINGSI